MNRLSIAFLSRDLPSLHPNGVSQQVHLMANELCRRGHRVTAFSLDPKPDDALYEVNRDTKTTGKLGRLFRPAKFFAKQDFSGFHLIHAHGDNYRLKGTVPVIRTFYGSALWEAWFDPRPLYKMRQILFYFLEWLAAFRSRTCVGISRASQKALPIIHSVIPCGIDPSQFQPAGNKTPDPSLIFIGNLSGRKGGWTLVSIFLSEVLPAVPHCRLTLVTGEKGPNHPNIDLRPRLSPKELAETLGSSWILCMASTYEGFGVPALEAWACQTAVLSTPHMGILEIAENSKTAVFCRKNTMGSQIIRLIEDAGLRRHLAMAGYEMSGNYTIAKSVTAYEELYGQLVQ